MTATVDDRLNAIEEAVQTACDEATRPRSDVLLLLVSKRQPLDKVQRAYDLGYRDFAENYVQALAEREAALPDDIRWHMIGHLQRNKAKAAISLAAMVHAVDSERLGAALSKGITASRPDGATLPVLVEVNVAQEEGKSGVLPDAAEPLLEALASLPGLALQGLMAPPVSGRQWFAELRQLRDRLTAATGLPLPTLSMGMSHDFADAIAEGATIVRVGSAAFGPRA